MKDFDWKSASKNRIGTRTPGDVSVRLNKAGTGRDGRQLYAVVFRFTPHAEAEITQGCFNRVSYAVWGAERVYFMGVREGKGFRVSHQKDIGLIQNKIDADMHLFWKATTGSYRLRFDADEDLYFIDLGKKIW